MSKTERIQIRVTPELKAQLQAAAEAENRTLTNYIENLLLQVIKNKGNALCVTLYIFQLF